MAATTFQERLARIEQRQEPTPEFVPMRFAQSQKKRRKTQSRRRRGAGQNLVSMATGGLLGALIGVVIHGATMAEAPWGPGTQYNELSAMIGLGGLLLSLPMTLLSVFMRSSKPGFFFFSVAYTVLVIAAVLI